MVKATSTDQQIPVARKRSHQLFGLPGPAEFLQRLGAQGIPLVDLVARHLAPGAKPEAILLSGSLAEGQGNAESDIDILVLVESALDLAPERHSLRLTTGQSSEVLVYCDGLEFNLEFVARDQQARLLASLVALAPALYDASEVERFTIIERFDLRFLHRLRTGWVLEGDNAVERWRDEFLVDLMPTYLAIRYFFEYRESAEDLASLRLSHPPSVPYVARQCAESLLAALLAASGFTSQSRKWFVRAVENLNGDALALARRALTMMFPPHDLADHSLERWLAELADIALEVEAQLSQSPECAAGLSFLEQSITYASPSEEIDGSG
jgi:hypothetical protein